MMGRKDNKQVLLIHDLFHIIRLSKLIEKPRIGAVKKHFL